MKPLAACLAFGLCTTGAVIGDDVRFASWNIANFTHVPGIELRPGIGTERDQSDFDALKRYAAAIHSDIIALQEIGSVEAVEMLFPPTEFDIFVASALARGTSQNEGEIYTAIVVKKRDDIVVLQQDDLEELAVIHEEDNRPVRSGTALQLQIDGEMIWVMSVHLKSSCSSTKNLPGSTAADCVTLWKQRVPLRNWIAEREAANEPFAIMGDFNRRFRQTGKDDPLWLALSGDAASQPNLVAHPLSIPRLCPTRDGNSNQPIDWIMLSTDLNARYAGQSFFETRYSFADANAHGKRLSDHCPISVRLNY